MFLATVTLFYILAVGGVFWSMKDRTRAVRRRILVLAIILGTPVDVAVIGEVYVRYLYEGTDTNRFFATTEKWLDSHVEKNTMGFRDDEWELENVDDVDGPYRIGVVGSAATLGQGVERVSDRFTETLERLLNAGADSVTYDVLNISELEWSTNDYLLALQRITPRLGLNEIIIVYSMTAVGDLTFSKDLLGQLRVEREEERRGWDHRWRLLDFWRTRAWAKRGVQVMYTGLREAYAPGRYWDFEASRLRRLAGYGIEGQPKLRFVVLPLLAEGWESYSFREAHRKVNSELHATGASTLDLLGFFESTAEPVGAYWAGRYDIHPNERAHQLIARSIFDTWYNLGR